MNGDVRWGILGAGNVAHGFALDLAASPGARLTAVASRTPESARALAALHPPARAHRSADDLFADPEVDVVYVATPNDRHADDATAALRHGKAVLCEKPFATNGDEAERIVDAARRHGVFCMEAMWMRFIPAVRRARELVESDALGEIRTLHADFSTPFHVEPTSRLFDPARGGGALLDLAIYPLSLAQLFLGEPRTIEATGGFATTGVDDHVSIVCGYEHGATALLSASIRTAGPNEALLAGTAATVRLPGPICAPRELIVSSVRAADPDPSLAPTGGLATLRHHPVLRRVLRRPHALVGRVRHRSDRQRFDHLGYQHEIAEVVRCLRAGELESSDMPLDESLAIMRQVDRVRAAIAG